MPDIYLACGAVVIVDDEDYDFVAKFRWRQWEAVPGRHLAVRDEHSAGRSFRVQLHREVAARFTPEMLEFPRLAVVSVANGNWLDVRRENLIVVVKENPGGRPPKQRGPIGYQKSSGRAAAAKGAAALKPDVSPLWGGGIVYARSRGRSQSRKLHAFVGSGPHRRAIAVGDGPLRDPADGHTDQRPEDGERPAGGQHHGSDERLQDGAGLAGEAQKAAAG